MAIISISDSQVNGANQILVADTNSKIPAKDGSQITILNATNVASGTIATARLDVGTTANKLVQLDGSGNLPVVDASLLTGIVSATISASDPTISTNPSGGVGTEWNNSTSGEMYICTDATAGENVWTNVGAGTGDIKLQFQGESYGYDVGGRTPTTSNRIEKYSYTSDGNSTDVSNLTVARDGVRGTTSLTYGYFAGGDGNGTIDKHQFATTNDATDVGDLITLAAYGATPNSSTYGYHVGGQNPATGDSGHNVIQKYSYASDGNSTDVGDAFHLVKTATGHSDWDNAYGYASGGSSDTVSPTTLNVIQRFSFSSNGNGTDVGNLAVAVSSPAGTSSTTHGYTMGGYNSGIKDHIQQFAFASSGDATDIANLFQLRYHPVGTSSTASGYTSSGNYSTGTAYTVTIDKFSFATGANSTDVGDCLTAHTAAAGSHY
jgi:hypothetical protein